MTSRIKIVGVQFAVNPDHEPETPMTAQENQRTIDLLTQLDRTHPRVTIKPEPTNAADKEALAVRLMSRKIGYVRNRDDYKSIAFAALAASGRGFFHARVVEVKVDEHGYFYVAVETENLPLVPIVHDDKWMEWEPPLPLFPMTEEMLSVDDAVMMLQELLTLITLTAEDEEEVRGYTEALVSTGKKRPLERSQNGDGEYRENDGSEGRRMDAEVGAGHGTPVVRTVYGTQKGGAKTRMVASAACIARCRSLLARMAAPERSRLPGTRLAGTLPMAQ